MAGDRIQYRRALERWDSLHNAQQFSLAKDIGYSAILYSLYSFEKDDEANEEIQIFHDEAHRIADETTLDGKRTAVIKGINEASLNEVLTEQEVSSITLIGHGDFSSVYMDSGEKYDWRDVSRNATHLKLGSIVQRFCGNYLREASVPFGTFALSDHHNVLAAKNYSFCPEDDPSDESRLEPVTFRRRLEYNDIKRLFPRVELKH